MNNTWRWIIGIVVGLALLGLLVAARSDRQSYWEARDTFIRHPVAVSQVANATGIRYSCTTREGPISTAKTCGFYVWKK